MVNEKLALHCFFPTGNHFLCLVTLEDIIVVCNTTVLCWIGVKKGEEHPRERSSALVIVK